MPKIARLPPDLANQIAAGEVVERPASVVKELVENALDAGARRILVAIELGGKKSIRVEDDGEGMSPDDARLALERHATSKIACAEDLAAIRTLGFRGEALPSIASVSHLALRTRARGAATGTEIRVRGGAVISVGEVGAPEGTSVAVVDLFFNVPARRKFLKSDAAEAAQISRIVTQLALGAPQVGFALTSGGRRLLQCPPARHLQERFYQLYGDRPELVEVRAHAAGLALTGYIAALAEQGPVRGAQNVFVNGRIVKDRTIAHAIIEAYSGATIKERSPEVHLFLELPADCVDVNVHPTKAEVRFLEQSLVHQVIRRALADALGRSRAPELQLRPAEVAFEPVSRALPGVFGGLQLGGRWASLGNTFGGQPEQDAAIAAAVAPRTSGDDPPPASTPVQDAPAAEIRAMIPLGQFRDTFIVAIDDEGIGIIDQHVAHERVLFEQIMERLTRGPLEAQRLLEPLLLELSADQRGSLAANRHVLERFGFELEEFGGGTMRVTTLPAVLSRGDCAAALRAFADDLEGLSDGSALEEPLKRLAATMACHAAVKANHPLTMEKMRHILDELRRTAYSSVCPHGRPVVLRLTRREIERNFQRI